MRDFLLKIRDIALSQENVWVLLIKTGIFLIILTPIVVIAPAVYPTVFPKVVYFRILVEIIFCFYVILLLSSNRKYLPRFSYILISLSVFVGILGLSTILSVNPFRSFWGTIERMEGFLTPLHLFVFFLILISVFKEKEGWLTIFRLIVLLSVLPGLAAIIQKLGIFDFYSPLSKGINENTGQISISRISGTFGNSTFYGSYLSLIIFLAIFLAIFGKEKFNKIFFWGLAGFNTLMLLYTGTRGAWIGVMMGVIFLSLAWFFSPTKTQEKKKIIVLFIVFTISFLFLLFLLFLEKGFLPATNVLDRYESIFESVVAFKNERLFVGKLGIEALKERPLFGFGPESFLYLYERDYRASFLSLIPEASFFDRAHNKIVDTLTSSGIVGLISYLFVFVSVISVLLKNKPRNNPLLSFILIASLIAYFVQNLFVFDMISSSIVFFFLLAFIDRNFNKEVVLENTSPLMGTIDDLVKPYPEKTLETKPEEKHSEKILYWAKPALGSLLIVFTVFFMIIANIRPFISSAYITKGINFFNDGEVKEGLDSFEKSSSVYDFTRAEHLYLSTSKIFLSPLASPSKLQVTSLEWKLISATLKNRAKLLEEYFQNGWDSKRMESYSLAVSIYKNLYIAEKDPKFLEDEERILEKMIRLNPQFLITYRFFGEMRILQKREKEAIFFFQKAYSVDKNLATLYEWLGLSLLESGEKERGALIFRKALKLGDFYTSAKFKIGTIQKIAYVYEEKGNYPEMARLYEEVLQFYPKELPPEPQIYASLAITYAKIGEKDKAREAAKKVAELFPQLRSETEEFLQNLEKPSK